MDISFINLPLDKIIEIILKKVYKEKKIEISIQKSMLN